MIILKAASESLQIVTTTTAAIDYSVSYVDITTTAFTPSSNEGKISSIATTPITPSLAASTQRQIKLLFISNTSASTNRVVVQKLITATNYNLTPTITLLAGETVQYMDGIGWTYYSATGSVKDNQTAAGSNTQLQLNNNGALSGDLGLTYNTTTNTLALADTNPMLQLGTSSTTVPAASPVNTLNVFARTIANRQMLAQVGPSGLDTALQPFLARNKVGYWDPQGNSTTLPGVFGITAPTTSGTVTTRNVATTSLATRMRRIGYVSSAVAGSLAWQIIPVTQFTCGSGAQDGSGFFMVSRFVPSNAATVSGERRFTGMIGSTANPTNVEPNTLTNAIGVAQLSTDATQLYLVYGGSTAQAAIALGSANFPAGTLSTTAYELAIFAPPGIANTFYVQVTNLTNGATYSNTLTGSATVVPQSSTLLTWSHWASNNATALAVGIDLCSLYIETDT